MTLLQAITGIVTALVAIGGFAGLIIQLKNLEKDLRANARGSLYDMAARIKEVFVEYPHLRKYFFEMQPIDRGSDNYERVLAVTDYYCLYLEQIATQAANIGPENRKAWLGYVASMYHTSPVLREYLEKNRDWYSSFFWQVIKEYGPDK